MSDARSEILQRIRRGLTSDDDAHAAETGVPRGYQRAGVLDAEARMALLFDRLDDYGAIVERVSGQTLAAAVASALAGAPHATLLAPPAIPAAWLPAGCRVLRDDPPLPRALLAQADAVLTTCAVAIAQTGTLVLQHDAAHGRRVLTLLPDHHICVLRPAQVVETVSEALARLDPTAPITTVSGPSATADIEMVRIRGVHGPRHLTVLLLSDTVG